jgi:hypothetical protein
MSRPETRSPDQRLWGIAGRWRTSGQVIGEPAIPVVGTDLYDVLPGGRFLVHHVDVTVGDQPVRAIGSSANPTEVADSSHEASTARATPE